MVSIEVFEKLKNEYGDAASWAIWSKVGKTPKSNIGDLSVFDDPKLLNKLNTKFVFVGLNVADHNSDAEIQEWSNFHSDDLKKGQDFKMRYAFEGTPCWGAYITDIIKDFKETDSSKVKKNIYKKGKPTELLEDNIRKFKKELEIIEKGQGSKPVLLALGGEVRRILENFFVSEGYTVIGLKHYSYRISKENLKREYDEILAKYYK